MKTIQIKEGTWHFWLAEGLGWRATRPVKVWETKDGVTYLKGYDVEPNDFCSYSRRVMLGLAIAGVLVGCICTDLYYCWLALHYWYLYFTGHKMPDMRVVEVLGAMSNVIIVCAATFISGRFWWDEYGDAMIYRWREKGRPEREAKKHEKRMAKAAREYEKEHTPPPKDEFLGAWYASVKDKICFKIKVTK
jgi:hypothetical protein